MVAIVAIDLERVPGKKKFADMHCAALKLTNHPESIQLRKFKDIDSYQLITSFSMRTTAQYKVVDQIFSEFEYACENYNGFIDMSVSFEK